MKIVPKEKPQDDIIQSDDEASTLSGSDKNAQNDERNPEFDVPDGERVRLRLVDGVVQILNCTGELDDKQLAQDAKQIILSQDKESRMKISNALMGLFRLSPDLMAAVAPQEEVDEAELAQALVARVKDMTAPVTMSVDAVLSDTSSDMDAAFDAWCNDSTYEADEGCDDGEEK